MSVYGIMRTGVSGMAAQANKLGAVSDNIANVNTVGYKRASVEFSSLISEGNHSQYNSGGVETTTRYAISDEGLIMGTTSQTDLAIKGNGFFVVSDAGGTPYMTRAGSFVPDGNYDLVNAAGFYLMGYPIQNGQTSVVANSLDGLERVNIANVSYAASPTTSGTIKGVLNSNATVVPAADLPSANAATSTYSSKASIVTYDSLGNKVMLDVYMAKTGTAPDAWEATVFNQAAASAGGFPYSAAPLATLPMTFNATGQLTTVPATLSVAIPGGSTAVIDLGGISQVATGETALQMEVDGNAPSAVDSVEFADDGTVYAVFENGERLATYRIPLATVPSVDQLTPLSGNIYAVSAMSGEVIVGFPETGSFGSIRAGALEQSNVDLASELTNMIEAQRSYTANSKVFQTGSEILDVLVNLKR
ncbi:MAG: flagellar hook protein FlgE [Chelatococcus sp.]|nr:MAG: flagellar hook protein FlgE [Chelatococcus sp.]